jgi:NDP-sugar pyrophosphorylase family protein
MRPLTENTPKTLLPVRGRPFAYYQLHWLASQGVTQVVYSIGHRGEMIRRYWEQEASPIPSLCYVDEGEHLLGTGGALSLAREQGVLENRFLVIYGDSFLPVQFAPVWRAFEASGLPALMTVLRNQGRWDRSNASYQDGRVLRYNKAAGPDMEYIDYGLSAFRREVLDGCGRQAFDLAELFQELSVEGKLAGFEVDRRFYEIGSPAGLCDFEEYLEREEFIVTS